MSTKFSRKTFLKGSVAGLGMMALNVCTAGAASAAEPAAAAAEDTNASVRRVERRNLVLGREAGEQLEVLQGLQPGETVVVTGQLNLVDGSRVRLTGLQAARP